MWNVFSCNCLGDVKKGYYGLNVLAEENNQIVMLPIFLRVNAV